MRRFPSVSQWLAIATALAAACTTPNPALDASSDIRDVAAEIESDAGPCTRNVDCDDEVFCNGVERCAPADPAADPRGCIAAAQPPCASTERCDEAGALCLASVDGGSDVIADGDEPCDFDHDGQESFACGGRDCDDHDVDRFAGNPERCTGNLSDGRPAADHDEDCNPCTVAGARPDGDRDNDLAVVQTCSNPWLDTTAPLGCDLNAVRLHGPTDPDPRTVHGSDCNDDPAMDGANVAPNLPEICGNAVDDNCDGRVDYSDRLFQDVDNDGRGDPATTMAGTCRPGWVTNSDDCDDTRPETYLGAREMCDGRDNDCSQPGSLRGDLDPSEDMDGDHYSPIGARCLGAGEAGALSTAFPRTDCNDGAATVHPLAGEICGNAIDEDCNGTPDDPITIGCVDADGDGRSVSGTMMTFARCGYPAGYAACPVGGATSDCNDNDPTVYPGAVEICDRVDSNCSTGGGMALDEDADDDGHAPLTAMCTGAGEAGAPSTAFPRTDCNDADRLVRPGAVESCDRVDSDCSSGGGVATEEDADNDGFAPITAACLARGEAGAASLSLPRGDCDDTRLAVNPGRPASDERTSCDGLDNDCNPITSELGAPCALGGACTAGGVCARALAFAGLASGSGHTCVRSNEGSVFCWGRNDFGQVGDGTATQRLAPVPVSGISNAIEIVAGSNHTCVRSNGGVVSCWGQNANGQLGDGTTNSRSVPTIVPGLVDVVALAAGSSHTCARMLDGTVRCWGGNTYGALGDGTTTPRSTPAAVPGLTDVVELQAGFANTCARRRDGTVLCWGRNTNGQVGDGTTAPRLTPTPVAGAAGAVELAVGSTQACARRSDGTVLCWGMNLSGEVGDGTMTMRLTPTAVTGLTSAVELAVGAVHSCARLADGTVRCWGDNNSGQLGDGTTTMRLTATAVTGLSGVVEIAASATNTCARLGDGTIRCWGGNSFGQLGDGTTTARPAATTGLSSVMGLTAGGSHACVRLFDGTVRCWGSNPNGQLGDGTTATSRPVPVPVTGLASVVEIEAGGQHTCARLGDGTVRCWGGNGDGALGDGTTTSRLTPTAVTGLANVVELAAGTGHTCARLVDGTARCWGSNGSGQLGDGTSMRRLTPVVVSGLSNVAGLAAGDNHTCARLVDGSIRCWGSNYAAQLGDGTTTTRSTPGAVTGIVGAVGLVARYNHSCAVLGDGTASCWGSNGSGEAGDGTTTMRLTPGVVTGLTGVAEAALGSVHGCARLADGTVRCWGDNTSGQVGDGTTTMRLAATAVTGLANVAEIAAGSVHTCVRRNDGAVSCWGWNMFGQLGDGTTTDRLTPTLVPSL